MNVSVHNLVGKTIQIRAVDPTTGKYGVTLCGGAPLTNGTSCTGIAQVGHGECTRRRLTVIIRQDWIAVETGGGYDAGDPFDQVTMGSMVLESGPCHWIAERHS